MKTKAYIALITFFIIFFQAQVHNPVIKHILGPGFASFQENSFTLKNGIMHKSFIAPLHSPDQNFTIHIINKKKNKQLSSEENLFIGIINYTTHTLLRKEIDLKIGTLRLDKMMLKIPLNDNINLWLKGAIPGSSRSENHFGLTYSGDLTTSSQKAEKREPLSKSASDEKTVIMAK